MYHLCVQIYVTTSWWKIYDEEKVDFSFLFFIALKTLVTILPNTLTEKVDWETKLLLFAYFINISLSPLPSSGIKVAVKCNQVKKLAVTTTGKDGTFKTKLPKDAPTSTHHGSLNCLARVLGGPDQIYASRKDMVSNVVKAHDSDDSSYTISKPLNFYTFKNSGIGSSKTIDLPLPKEWGLAPSSYYLNPFVPIIGIP